MSPSLGPPTKKRRLDDRLGLSSAIEAAGLTEKATVNGIITLSILTMKERATVLEYLGDRPGSDDPFRKLFDTACQLKASGGKFPDSSRFISTISSTTPQANDAFPVVDTSKLYVRQIYKKLYKEITESFQPPTYRTQNRFVVTGTSGIGKSVFLVYLALRLLAESDDDHPPLIVFHIKTPRRLNCYAFGGTSFFRTGTIDTFNDLLIVPETWYLVDSVQQPHLCTAKTVISISPKTLLSDTNEYQEVSKASPTQRYMAPWSFAELKACRKEAFPCVPFSLMKRIYIKLGGVPRYVLQTPATELVRRFSNNDDAEECALKRFEEALTTIRDIGNLLECVAQNKDNLAFSSRLLHWWPLPNLRGYYLKWASSYAEFRIYKVLKEQTWAELLKRFIRKDDEGATRGLLFEIFVHHIFRKGGLTFKTKQLGESAMDCEYDMSMPVNPKVKFIRH